MSVPSAFALLHRPGRPFVLPNAWDVASALLLADAGHRAIGTTSLGITAAAGLADGAGEGLELTFALTRTLVRRLSVPLTVDLEGGYADDPATVAALAGSLAQLGVAGVNLEDGRADGRLRTVDDHAAIIEAVVAESPSLFVNARTDTYWLRHGDDDERFGEAVRRLRAYRDAGASGAFVPGLSDLARIEAVARTVDLPLNVLWRPDVHLTALASAGVARISTGSALYRHALAAALGAAAAAGGAAAVTTVAVEYDHLQDRLGAVRNQR